MKIVGKIVRIKGNIKRENSDGFLLLADEQCIFGIGDLFDNSGKGALTWHLKDNKGIVLFTKKGKWNDTLLLSIQKKLCGDYHYSLGASFNSTVYPSVSVGGYCKQKITGAKTGLPQKTGCGIIKGQITIEAEGLNGNALSLDAEFSDTCLSLQAVKCVEGIAVFEISIDTFQFFPEILKTGKDVEKSLKVKIRDGSGNYIKDNAGNEIVLEQNMTVSGFCLASPQFPANNTIASVK